MPRSYGKKVWIRPSGLPTIKEEMEEMEKEINDEIFKDLGNFGDIVEKSRDQILEGYCRPRNMESPPRPKEIVDVPDIPPELPSFDKSFEESKYERWAPITEYSAALEAEPVLPQVSSLLQEISDKVSHALSKTAIRTQRVLKTLTEISDAEHEEESSGSEEWTKVKAAKKKVQLKKMEANRVKADSGAVSGLTSWFVRMHPSMNSEEPNPLGKVNDYTDDPDVIKLNKLKRGVAPNANSRGQQPGGHSAATAKRSEESGEPGTVSSTSQQRAARHRLKVAEGAGSQDYGDSSSHTQERSRDPALLGSQEEIDEDTAQLE